MSITGCKALCLFVRKLSDSKAHFYVTARVKRQYLWPPCPTVKFVKIVKQEFNRLLPSGPDPQSTFVNNHFLEHSHHAHLFPYYLWMLTWCNVDLLQLQQGPHGQHHNRDHPALYRKRSLTPTVEHQQLHKECDTCTWFCWLEVKAIVYLPTHILLLYCILQESKPEVLTYEKEVKFHNPQEIMQVIAEYVSWRAWKAEWKNLFSLPESWRLG